MIRLLPMTVYLSCRGLPPVAGRAGGRNLRVGARLVRALCAMACLGLVLFGFAAHAADGDPPAAPPPAKIEALGSIEGVVTYRGENPKSRYADEEGHYRDLLEVDPKSRGVRYVVVFIGDDEAALKRAAPQTNNVPTASPPVVIDQKDYIFVPHLIAVRAGQAVRFTNSDAANHNVRTLSAHAKNFFNVFTGNGHAYEHRFVAEPSGRAIPLGCDIHPWMRGWVYVFDHAGFAVTDEQGRFVIPKVPAGRHKLVLQQPDVEWREERSIEVTTKAAIQVKVEMEREKFRTR